jgi:hypothetical protein
MAADCEPTVDADLFHLRSSSLPWRIRVARIAASGCAGRPNGTLAKALCYARSFLMKDRPRKKRPISRAQ